MAAKTASHARLQETAPRARLQETAPRAWLQETAPRARLQETAALQHSRCPRWPTAGLLCAPLAHLCTLALPLRPLLPSRATPPCDPSLRPLLPSRATPPCDPSL
eukprot:307173-Chlamydomonas_euryale.AAC.1